MKTKTYITVLLTFIFLAKFTAIDANALNALFSGNDVTFVNPYCKKKNSSAQTNKTTSFSQVDLATSQVIDLNGFCTSQFQFELFTWETKIPKPVAVFNEHISSNLSYLYLDIVSPPPRLS